ncbi:MAG: pentapeptide repeat-containing protein [Microcoleus sp.]
MTESRNLNFSNQDLRNRSFKGLDLSGANFSGCDIRGCNFAGAILTGANFQGARMGESRRRVRTLIARAGVTAVAVTMAGALMGLIRGADAGAAAVAAVAATAIAATRADAGIVAGAVAGAAAAIGASGIVTFFGGDTIRGIVLVLVSGVMLGLTAIGFFIAVEEIEKLSMTSFRKADVTDAIFEEDAMLNADFSDALGCDW